ncbi:SMI1/KNR4 family protein [Streptomyces aurantiacus]|uniref:SMI1/KNR4 family protein n=1 Tax=Streptomyces aurantiacus TaxID=47760 RepID=UPI00332FC5E8
MTETNASTGAGPEFGWREFLTRWSEEWAGARDPGEEGLDGDEEALRARWLGFAPATPERIAALEERLGRRLPPSYRSFLEVTDGWRHAGGFVYLLGGTEHVRWHRDEAGLGEMFREYLDEDASPEEIDEADLWDRALDLGVESDAVYVVMDPQDVDEHGEWAVYTWAPWRASPPERHGAFRDFMQEMYREFHSLRADRDDAPQFANATTEALDANVSEARRDALRGDYERAERLLTEAREFGRPRAKALLDQIKWLLGDTYLADFGGLAADPVYEQELLPVLAAEHAEESWRDDDSFKFRVGAVPAELTGPAEQALRQARERTFVYAPEGPFGAAVRAAREQARWGETDAAWHTLLAALPEWRPLGPDQLAPVGLLADPLLAPVLTAERRRELLATPRGGEATGTACPAADVSPDGLAWLADRELDGPRQAYRFVLVEGVEARELPAVIGAKGDTALRAPMARWEADARGSLPYDEALVAVGRAGPGWSFAFDADPLPFHAPRFASPAVAASRNGRAVVVWAAPAEHGQPALFHLSVAERGEERYACTVQGTAVERSGDIPEALDPERLFRQGRWDEAAALAAIAAAFGVSLPRHALTEGRLHTFVTRSWTRPPGPGETYLVASVRIGTPEDPQAPDGPDA